MSERIYGRLYNFFDCIQRAIESTKETNDKLIHLCDRAENADRILIVGNGGSNAIAGHVAEDWTKICGFPSVTLNDTALMSCFANDYGWDNWIAEAIQQTGWEKGRNLGIFISSGGRSPNIINGCRAFHDLGQYTVTLSGFADDNPLSTMGDINFHIPCSEYNVVELTHEAWLLSICEISRSRAK